MGKPFDSELAELENTIEWSANASVEALSKFLNRLKGPVYIIGSGGSLSACYFLTTLLNGIGKVAMAVTPLDVLNLEKTLPNSSVIFLTASGGNYDILFSFKRVLEFEPLDIGIITMKTGSKLGILADSFSIAKVFEFALPSGKDGFLATNSLLAFFSLLYKALSGSTYNSRGSKNNIQEIYDFLNKTQEQSIFTILYSAELKAIAYDIESKCTEAGLFATLLADYRNFGHGRHHWFAKNTHSAIIALANPKSEALCRKTLSTLPKHIPKLILKSKHFGSKSAMDLLIKSFYLVKAFGEKRGIDPGRPGVPGYGRKLYHLPYSNLFNNTKDNRLSRKIDLAIKRKTRLNDLGELSNQKLKQWVSSYQSFMNRLGKTDFGGVIMDYDGTLCGAAERFQGPSNPVFETLNQILQKGYVLGIVTGRGKSVRTDLQSGIPKKYWAQIIIGYYNGSVIGKISVNTLPDLKAPFHKSLIPINKLLEQAGKEYGFTLTKRPTQTTIEVGKAPRWDFTRNLVIQLIKTSDYGDVQILESSHSLDIIPIEVSKTNVFQSMFDECSKRGLPSNFLAIGDKGQWPGNDFALLDTPFGLSVDTVSSKMDACWNIASLGNRNVAATLEYLNRLEYKRNGMKFKL